MGRYAYDEWTGKAADKKSLSEKVQDKFKDFCDNIRYFMLTYRKYKDPLPEPGKRKHEDAHDRGRRLIRESVHRQKKGYRDIRLMV